MLILGHAGITLGAATLLAGGIKSGQADSKGKLSWFAALSNYVDIRFLLIGSMLPDIIDKPVGQYFFRETFSNGRIFSHSLLFLIIITAAGFILYKSRRQIWLLSLAAGSFMHLILDEIWRTPSTLFWPFLGFTFIKSELSGWAMHILEALISNPKIYISEAVGLAVLIWFGLVLLTGKRVGVFIKYGKVN